MAITCLHSGPVGSFPKFIRVPKIIAFGTPGCNTGGFRKDVRGGHFGKIWIQKIGLGFGETGKRSGEEGMLRCSYCSLFTSVRIRKVERYVRTRLYVVGLRLYNMLVLNYINMQYHVFDFEKKHYGSSKHIPASRVLYTVRTTYLNSQRSRHLGLLSLYTLTDWWSQICRS